VSDANILATLTVDDFTPHVGRAFEITAGGQATSMRLASAQAIRQRASAPRASFSLVFTGEASLGQGIHTVVHPELGALDIFLVPIGPGSQGLQYEAVFN
jgi:hypothetical protein